MSRRLLVVSDLAMTGFGRVGREFGARFIAAGWDLRIIGVNYRGRDGEAGALARKGASPDEIARFLTALDMDPVLQVTIPASAGGDTMGHNLIPPAVNGSLFGGWRPERILLVADPEAMRQRLAQVGDALRVPTFNYVPIEGSGLPPTYRAMWKDVVPVAMSRFGQEQLVTLLGRDVAMITHGVSDAFKPADREQARRKIGVTDHLVFLRTDRFVPRKNYAALFRTMAPVLATHPEAVLIIHCSPVDEGGDLGSLLSRMPGAFEIGGVWRHPQVRFTGGHDTFRGVDDGELAELYSAADVYVSPTRAEGFGLTLAEAAACGVPVVTTDYAAGPEAVGPGGSLARVDRLDTNQFGFEWASVDETHFSELVVQLADDAALRGRQGEAGREWVGRFSWDQSALDMLAVLE